MTIQKVKRNAMNTKVNGNIIMPIGKNVLVRDMKFDGRITSSGIILPGDDGKDSGIRPRWAEVYAVGPEQTDVKVGEWILVEHGRWTRGVEHELENGELIELRMVDNNAIMMSADEPPADIMLAFQSGTPAANTSNVGK
jgi:co-chaperonin GroES (HSP10)